jgi:hypothetical protein
MDKINATDTVQYYRTYVSGDAIRDNDQVVRFSAEELAPPLPDLCMYEKSVPLNPPPSPMGRLDTYTKMRLL